MDDLERYVRDERWNHTWGLWFAGQHYWFVLAKDTGDVVTGPHPTALAAAQAVLKETPDDRD